MASEEARRMKAVANFLCPATFSLLFGKHRETDAKNFRARKYLILDRWAYQSIQDKGPPPSEWMQAIARFGQSQPQTGFEQKFSTDQ
jgi:hypothetical protein